MPITGRKQVAHSKQVNKENLMKRLFAKVQAALQNQQRMPKHPELASAGGTYHTQAGGGCGTKGHLCLKEAMGGYGERDAADPQH